MSLTTEQKSLVEQGVADQAKSMRAAYAMWFFFGVFVAAHRYYLSHWKSALVHDLLVATFLLAFVGSGASASLRDAVQPYFFVLFAIGVFIAIWWIADAFLMPGLQKQFRAKLRARLTAEFLHLV